VIYVVKADYNHYAKILIREFVEISITIIQEIDLYYIFTLFN